MATSASEVESVSGQEASPGYYGWRVVLAAHFGVMVSFGSLLVFTFGIFLKPVSVEFGWSREAVSAAFGFAAMTVAVCSPVLGGWLDKYPPKRIVLPCMGVFGVAFASLGLLTHRLWHLYAVFILMGAVGNGSTQMGYSRAVASWFDRRRGVALSIIMAGVGVGSVVFPVAAQAIIGAFGWRAAYFVLGGVVLLLGIPLTARYLREKEIPQHRVCVHDGATVKQGLQSAAFWILVTMLFLSSVSINGAITHLSALLTDRGIDASGAALAASALGVTSFLARLLTGYLLDRFFGPRVAFCVLSVTALGILLLAQAANLATGLSAAALIGIGLGGEAGITPYLLTRYFGLRSFSTLYGFTWTVYAFAGALGPVILGRAFDVTGSYTHLLQALSVSTFLAGALMLFMPRYRLLLTK